MRGKEGSGGIVHREKQGGRETEECVITLPYVM